MKKQDITKKLEKYRVQQPERIKGGRKSGTIVPGGSSGAGLPDWGEIDIRLTEIMLTDRKK